MRRLILLGVLSGALLTSGAYLDQCSTTPPGEPGPTQEWKDCDADDIAEGDDDCKVKKPTTKKTPTKKPTTKR